MDNENRTQPSTTEAVKPDAIAELVGQAGSSEKSGKADKGTHVRVLKVDHEKLLAIKLRRGYRSIGYAIHSLLEEKEENTVSVEAMMKNNVPIVLQGKPEGGKTYFIKHELLPSLEGSPVLLIDTWDEYKELRNVGHNIYGLDFRNFREHIRFVPNRQSNVARTEVGGIFALLDMKKDEMARWIVVVEEAHSFRNLSAFAKFLYGSRHVVRKMIAVTPQTDAFQGLETLMASH